jgi:holo-[acyl-carrier protein] synthase
MIKGIGIDMTDVKEVERLMNQLANSFVQKTFTEKEVEISKSSPNPAEYLATRFAVKEAVFKAVAHLTKTKSFDFRIVETLNEDDGNPYINISSALQEILNDAGVNSLLVSITTEGDYATAFVLAQGSGKN